MGKCIKGSQKAAKNRSKLPKTQVLKFYADLKSKKVRVFWYQKERTDYLKGDRV